MNDPVNYSGNTQSTLAYTEAALAKFSPLLKWRTEGQDIALDAGCGPGDTLEKVWYPVFKDRCSKIYAVDISDSMLKYCKEQHPKLEKVHYWKMNLERTSDVDQFLATHGPIDHILMGYLVHWFVDHDLGWRNIYKLLRPGGDFISVHFHTTITYQMHQHLMDNDKWAHYFDDLNIYTPKSTLENHSEKELVDALAHVGFTGVVVELTRGSLIVPPEAFFPIIQSVHVQIEKIPKYRLEEYLKDYLKLAKEKNLLRVTSSGQYEVDFHTYAVYGQRPE